MDQTGNMDYLLITEKLVFYREFKKLLDCIGIFMDL